MTKIIKKILTIGANNAYKGSITNCDISKEFRLRSAVIDLVERARKPPIGTVQWQKNKSYTLYAQTLMGGMFLDRLLIAANKKDKLIYPAPSELLDIFEAEVSVNRIFSTIAWRFLLLFRLLSLIRLFAIYSVGLFPIKKMTRDGAMPTAVFANFNRNASDSFIRQGINNYRKLSGDKNTKYNQYAIIDIFQKDSVLQLCKLGGMTFDFPRYWRLQFVFLQIFLRGALACLGSAWHECFLSKEKVLDSVVREIGEQKKFPLKYIFEYSNTLHIPLWLETLRSKGAVTEVFFYSTYLMPHSKNSNQSQKIIFCSSNWDKVYALEGMGFLFKNLNIDLVYSKAGLSWRNKKNNKKDVGPYIALFDVSPTSIDKYRSGGYYPCYLYKDNLWERFFGDILFAAKKSHLRILYKTKYEVTEQVLHSVYYRAREKFIAANDIVVKIDHETSPELLCRRATCVISIPFTTPSCYYPDKSAYYDPLEYVSNSVFAGTGLYSGIRIIHEVNDLRNFIRSKNQLRM